MVITYSLLTVAALVAAVLNLPDNREDPAWPTALFAVCAVFMLVRIVTAG
jgi:hypothetical protein